MTKTRTLSILARIGGGRLLVEIKVGRERSRYTISPVAPFSGVGRAWLMEGCGRKAASHYEVSVTGCECRARVDCCRHRAALLTLLELGKL